MIARPCMVWKKIRKKNKVERLMEMSSLNFKRRDVFKNRKTVFERNGSVNEMECQEDTE